MVESFIFIAIKIINIKIKNKYITINE